MMPMANIEETIDSKTRHSTKTNLLANMLLILF